MSGDQDNEFSFKNFSANSSPTPSDNKKPKLPDLNDIFADDAENGKKKKPKKEKKSKKEKKDKKDKKKKKKKDKKKEGKADDVESFVNPDDNEFSISKKLKKKSGKKTVEIDQQPPPPDAFHGHTDDPSPKHTMQHDHDSDDDDAWESEEEGITSVRVHAMVPPTPIHAADNEDDSDLDSLDSLGSSSSFSDEEDTSTWVPATQTTTTASAASVATLQSRIRGLERVVESQKQEIHELEDVISDLQMTNEKLRAQVGSGKGDQAEVLRLRAEVDQLRQKEAKEAEEMNAYMDNIEKKMMAQQATLEQWQTSHKNIQNQAANSAKQLAQSMEFAVEGIQKMMEGSQNVKMTISLLESLGKISEATAEEQQEG